MEKCHCGHTKNFHRIIPNTFVSRMFPPSDLGKVCNIKECQCLRYTPLEE